MEQDIEHHEKPLSTKPQDTAPTIAGSNKEHQAHRETLSRRQFLKACLGLTAASVAAPLDIVPPLSVANAEEEAPPPDKNEKSNSLFVPEEANRILKEKGLEEYIPYFNMVRKMMGIYGDKILDKTYFSATRDIYKFCVNVAAGSLSDEQIAASGMRKDDWGKDQAVLKPTLEKRISDLNVNFKTSTKDQSKDTLKILGRVERFSELFPYGFLVPQTLTILEGGGYADNRNLGVAISREEFFVSLFHESQHAIERRYDIVKKYMPLEQYMQLVTGITDITNKVADEWFSLPYEQAMHYKSDEPLMLLYDSRYYGKDRTQMIEEWEKVFGLQDNLPGELKIGDKIDEGQATAIWETRYNRIAHYVGGKLKKGESQTMNPQQRAIADEVMSIFVWEVQHLLDGPFQENGKLPDTDYKDMELHGVDKFTLEAHMLRINTIKNPSIKHELSPSEIRKALGLDHTDIPENLPPADNIDQCGLKLLGHEEYPIPGRTMPSKVVIYKLPQGIEHADPTYYLNFPYEKTGYILGPNDKFDPHTNAGNEQSEGFLFSLKIGGKIFKFGTDSKGENKFSHRLSRANGGNKLTEIASAPVEVKLDGKYAGVIDTNSLDNFDLKRLERDQKNIWVNVDERTHRYPIDNTVDTSEPVLLFREGLAVVKRTDGTYTTIKDASLENQ